MSSPDAPAPIAARRTCLSLATRLARFAVIGVLAGGLAGCFQPMYAENATVGGTPLLEKLRSIEIVKIDGRLGNELRNDLIFEFTGGAGNPVGAPYKLYIVVAASAASSIVDTASGLPENKIIHVSANWRLMRAGEENKPPVTVGRASGTASIDVSDQRFANYRATRDAEARAARVVVEQMQAQLIAYFVNPPPAAGAPAPAAAPATPAAAKPPAAKPGT